MNTTWTILLKAFLTCTLGMSMALQAQEMNRLQDVTILSYHFTTTIQTRQKTLGTTDPTKGRYVILKLSARAGRGASVFASDFVLAYTHSDGQEDRASCDALGTATSVEAGDFDEFYPGSATRMTMKEGTNYFGLAFYVERDVRLVSLYRIGTAAPITYAIGPDRQYSVFLTTNARDPNQLSQVRSLLETGDYDVHTSTVLAKDESGVSVWYTEKAESAAREIAARLTTKLSVAPRIKKSAMLSEHDVVVWLGK